MDEAPDTRWHTHRLAAVGVGGAVSVLLLAGALWLGYRALFQPGGAGLPVVAAPEGDYKVAPEDRGGLDIGHRDVRVYEALVRGRQAAAPEAVGPLPEAPRPVAPLEEAGVAPVPEPPEKRTGPPIPIPAPRGGALAAAPSGGPAALLRRPLAEETGVAVQVGAFRTAAAARNAWAALRKDHEDLLGGIEAAFVPGNGLVRVQAGPALAPAAAEIVCEKLKARNVDCFIVR